MKLNVRSLFSLFLVCFTFFFTLACFDFIAMHVTGSFSQDPDLMYRYWILLGLIVTIFGFGLAFMGYIAGMNNWTCAALLGTVLLLFAGGLLDEFWELLAYLQGSQYSWNVWSAQFKWFGFWNGLLQALWSLAFYGAIVAIWYFVLRKK